MKSSFRPSSNLLFGSEEAAGRSHEDVESSLNTHLALQLRNVYKLYSPGYILAIKGWNGAEVQKKRLRDILRRRFIYHRL